MPDEAYLVVSTTAPDRERARAIAQALLDARLAASVQILGPIESHYWWRDERHQAEEFLCVARTRASLYERVEAAIIAVHPYVTPEIIATPISAGSSDCLSWIARYATGG